MRNIVAGGIIVCLLALGAFILPIYYVNLLSQVLVAVVLAASLNILVGHGGLDSLCHAALAGIVSYAVIFLFARLGFGHAAAVTGALLCGIVVTMLFGAIALRASGLGFLMITIALGLVAWGLAYRWVGVTGGDHGLGGLRRPVIGIIDFASPTQFFLLALGVTVASLWVIWRFVQSPIGVALQGARDQERRMSALGYNVWLIRWVAFVVAGFFAGVSGVLFAYYHQFVSPMSLSVIYSAEAYLMVLAGGAGTFAGPIAGATIVTLIKLWVSSYVERWVMLLGFMYVLVVLFMPGGIAPTIARLWRGKLKLDFGRSGARSFFAVRKKKDAL